MPDTVEFGGKKYKVTSIDQAAFYQSANLTSVVLPNSIVSMGTAAFSNCVNLKSATLPDKLSTIDQAAFYECNQLESVQMPTVVNIISASAFYNCGKLSSVDLPSGLSMISEYAFYGCDNLTSVDIPATVTKIEQGAFANCSNLTDINIDSNNSTYCSEDGIVYSIDYKTILQYPANRIGHITIRDGVTSIYNYAFSGCKMSSLDIPNTVESILSHAFRECINLSQTIIPNSVTTLGQGGFYECTNLNFVQLSNKISSIAANTFYGCTNLKSIIIPPSVSSLGAFCFQNCSQLKTVFCLSLTPPTLSSLVFKDISSFATLYVPTEAVESYQSINGYSTSFAEIKSMTIGESEVEDITETSAVFKWLPDTAVTQYTITIYTDGNPFATYTVNADGTVIDSQRFAPQIIKGDTTVSTSEYFVLTINQLSASTNYTYTIKGVNSVNEPVYYEEGAFRTEDEQKLPSSFEQRLTTNDQRLTTGIKFLRNGHLLILHNNHLYNTSGTRIE